MTIVIGRPSEKQVREELRAMKRASKRAYATPASTRAFLLKHGFITKSGKLHPNYR